MQYFKFKYEPGLSYSPGWHGTRDHDFPATVLLYNDKEGYGIGCTKSEITKDCAPLTEEEALKEVDAVEESDKVFKNQSLADRWLPEATIEDIEDTPETLSEISTPERKAVDTFTRFCPICHKTVAYIVKYDDGTVKVVQAGKTLIQGLKAASINLTCASGHRVKVVCDG